MFLTSSCCPPASCSSSISLVSTRILLSSFSSSTRDLYLIHHGKADDNADVPKQLGLQLVDLLRALPEHV